MPTIAIQTTDVPRMISKVVVGSRCCISNIAPVMKTTEAKIFDKVELAEQHIPFSFEDHTLAHSIYVFDPDGHRVELTTYELA